MMVGWGWGSGELGVDNVRVLVPVVDADPHLSPGGSWEVSKTTSGAGERARQKDIPHLSKRAQPRQNAPADPRRVLALGRGKDLDAHVFDRDALDFRQQAVAEALGQRAAAGEHDVGVEVLAEVQVRAVDGVDYDLVHAGVFQADDLGVEEDLGGAEALGADLWGVSVVSVSSFFDRLGEGRPCLHTLSLLPSGNTYSAIRP